MGSAAGAEIGSTYINAQDDVLLQTCLIEMGYPQPPTKLQIDNTTVEASPKVTLKQKLSKSIDMHFLAPRLRNPGPV